LINQKITLALIHALNNDLDEAIALLSKALESSIEIYGYNNLNTADCAYYLGKLYYNLGDKSKAVFYLKMAINAAQNIRFSLVSLEQALQTNFLSSNENRYTFLAKVLLEMGRDAEAQMVISLLKDAELTLSLQPTGSNFDEALPLQLLPGNFDDNVLNVHSNLSYTISSLTMERQELLLKKRKGIITGDEEDKLREINNNLDLHLVEYRAFVDNLSELLNTETYVEAERLSSIANLETLQGTLKALGDGTVLIHTLISTDKLYLFLTSKDLLLVKSVDVKKADLENMVREFSSLLQQPTLDPRAISKELYDLLILPLKADLDNINATTIMFSLDGILRYIPMSALYNGEKWLIEDYAISIFTEASRDKIRVSFPDEAAAVALGLYSEIPGFIPLPEVEDEINSIIKGNDESDGVISGIAYFNDKFTYETLSDSLLLGFTILHIASHFNFNTVFPDQSFLLLGDGSNLTVRELSQKSSELPLNGLDLLTLSACNTATGVTTGDGSEFESFAAIALNRGVLSVIATLWPVNDASTAQLMKQFYFLRYQEAMDKAAALRAAQVSVMNSSSFAVAQRGTPASVFSEDNPPAQRSYAPWPGEGFSHPWYWAPFVLMGNWK
ncbi:MAG: CHAT domain-containing protein, partial [Deltaproteobacteria bacterium]|nr:CHAT domain-containing protein [Deltaproteobacteria bacterium]